MKTFIQIILAGVVMTGMTGCVSVKGYYVDRGRDARDVFTATAGLGLGAVVRAGPIHVGVLANHDIIGLRDSAFGYYTLSMNKGDGVALQYEAAMIPVPGPYREGLLGTWKFGLDVFMARFTEGRRLKSDYEVRSLIPFVATVGMRHQYYTQLEVVLGFGPTFRLGINPGEFADFILGWMTIDIFSDDLEAQREQSHQSAHTTDKSAPQQ